MTHRQKFRKTKLVFHRNNSGNVEKGMPINFNLASFFPKYLPSDKRHFSPSPLSMATKSLEGIKYGRKKRIAAIP